MSLVIEERDIDKDKFKGSTLSELSRASFVLELIG